MSLHTFILVFLLYWVVCSYNICDFFLLSKYLFMLVRNGHCLTRIVIGRGRQSILLQVCQLERQRTKGANALSRADRKTKKCPKEGQREGSGRVKAAAAQPDKPCGLYLLLKFFSVRTHIVTSLKSTAIYKLTLLCKSVL